MLELIWHLHSHNRSLTWYICTVCHSNMMRSGKVLITNYEINLLISWCTNVETRALRMSHVTGRDMFSRLFFVLPGGTKDLSFILHEEHWEGRKAGMQGSHKGKGTQKKPRGSSASCVKSRLFPKETSMPLTNQGHPSLQQKRLLELQRQNSVSWLKLKENMILKPKKTKQCLQTMLFPCCIFRDVPDQRVIIKEYFIINEIYVCLRHTLIKQNCHECPVTSESLVMWICRPIQIQNRFSLRCGENSFRLQDPHGRDTGSISFFSSFFCCS